MRDQNQSLNEKETLLILRQKAQQAGDLAWDAHHTHDDLFSDAKFAVYEVKIFIEQTDIIREELHSQLLNLATEGYGAIMSSSGLPNRLRAGKTSEMMAKICQEIDTRIAEISAP
ncbi:MAG: hypothetical protein ACRC1Z_26180 [Waterburya sp.]